MEYLKKFNTESDYIAYRDGGSYLKPNVSLSDDHGSVFYNFTPPPINSNGYEYVDLGLPNHTLWATCNVGASNPSDYGQYFKWCNTSISSDLVGTSATLKLEEDAAHINMGGDWHMPTSTQIQELIDNTTTAWTTSDDGVTGMTFTSKNGNSIFIPAAGDADNDGQVSNTGSIGSIWSSTISDFQDDNGMILKIDSMGASLDTYGSPSDFKRSIRGVIG